MSKITMAHGAGGKFSADLIKEIILPAFDNEFLNELHDGAKLGKLAMTTDSYVVRPLFFRGGNIGKLSICGTVNDLAVTGAIPKYISVGAIMAAIRRLHDLNRSGWFLIAAIIPLLNFVLGIYLLFFKGTEGYNQYGEDPLAI